MKSFKQFITEKDVSDVKDSTLYIAVPLPQKHWDLRADQVKGIEDAVEVEQEPHATFLWCYLEGDYDTQLIYDTVKPLMSGLEFEFKDMGFEVFEGVDHGKQDCLVVRLEAPEEIIQLQKDVKNALKDAGIKFKQTFPNWKPHMTIAYFDRGFKLAKKHNYRQSKPFRVPAGQPFMKHDNGEVMKF